MSMILKEIFPLIKIKAGETRIATLRLSNSYCSAMKCKCIDPFSEEFP